MTAAELIASLKLEPLPLEGGYYRQTYQSDETLAKDQLKGDYPQDKCLYTAIYYLLTPDTKSALHLLPTDEIFHFYLGDPVTMLNLFDDGTSGLITLGHDLSRGHRVQYKVPQHTWQGSILMPGGHYALMGTTMAPGFDFSDYQGADQQALVNQYPEHKQLINLLTS